MNPQASNTRIYRTKLRISFLAIIYMLAILLDFVQSRYLPLYLNLDWTLIFVFYIGWSTDAVRGAATGTVFGLTQDFLLGTLLGINGGIKTIIGYSASSLSTVLNPDLEGIMRFLLVAGITLVNNILIFKSQYMLSGFEGDIPLFNLLTGSLLTGIAADLLFRILDRIHSSPKQFFD